MCNHQTTAQNQWRICEMSSFADLHGCRDRSPYLRGWQFYSSEAKHVNSVAHSSQNHPTCLLSTDLSKNAIRKLPGESLLRFHLQHDLMPAQVEMLDPKSASNWRSYPLDQKPWISHGILLLVLQRLHRIQTSGIAADGRNRMIGKLIHSILNSFPQ